MTRAKRGSCKYKNLVDGNIVIEEDSLFQERSQKYTFDFLKSTIFRNIDYNIINTGKDKEHVLNITKDDGSKIYFSFFRVVNAGMQTDRKRMQIPCGYFGVLNSNNPRRENDNYFFIGIYPTGLTTKPIYVILDNDGFSLNPRESYSSLWINFDSLVIANRNGIHYAINKINGNKFVCFKEEKWELIYNSIINNDFSSIIDNTMSYVTQTGQVLSHSKENNIIEDYNELRDAYVLNKKPKLKKNSNFRDLILYESNYTCSLCGKNTTFKTNANVMYFEAHHLIPCNFNMQQNFEKKLDAPENMFCLCPECHRKIHFINDQEVDALLKQLFEQRKSIYDKNYKIDLNNLLNIYKKIDRKNEEDM